MNYEHTLEKIGLTSEQAQIYGKLSQYGEMSIYEIAQKTGLHRPRIYKVLPSLVSLSLVSKVIKGKRNFYCAESPQNLALIFQQTQKEFSDTLEYYFACFKKQADAPKLKTIHGKMFSLSIFDDVLRSLEDGECHYRYSSRDNFQDDDTYNTRRLIGDKKGIQLLSITNKLLFSSEKKSLNHESKCIPEEFGLFEDNISKVIYKDKVAIIDYDNETSSVIENKKFAEFEAKIFRFLYKKL